MKPVLIGLISVAMFSASAASALQWDDPQEASRKVYDQTMANAQAQKARNDAIVAQQREAERKAKAKASPTPTATPKKGTAIQQ